MAIGRFAELEDALVERVLELKAGRPLHPLQLVVGSAAQRARLQTVLLRRLGAVANVEVLSLARFARQVVAQARGAPPVVVAGIVRERLVRGLVEKRDLSYFSSVQDRPRFALALAATFADLREGLVEPSYAWAEAALLDGGRNDGRRQPAHDKAADLQALYAAYCDALAERGLLDETQVLVEAVVHLSQGRLAAGSEAGANGTARCAAVKAIFYGVYDVNRAQEELLRVSLAAGADIFVPREDVARSDGSVLDLARAAGLTERDLAPPPVARDADRLSALWRATPSVRGVLELCGDGTLEVLSVADERAEVREAVRAVLAAAVAGAALYDCAVVVAHGDEVERYAAGLEAAGLPVAARRRDRSVGPRVLLRLLECLAPQAGESFSRRAVVDLLRAAPLAGRPPEPREAALWLDEARRAGVVAGLPQWAERIGRRRRGLARRLEQTASAAADAESSEDGEEALGRQRLRGAATARLAGAIGALAKVCGDLPAKASWAVWAEVLSTIAEAVFQAPAAAAVRDAAGRLRALDVIAEEVDVAHMAAVLREQLAGARTPSGRVGREGVAVLAPLEARGLRFHTVVLAGLAEGGFPARGRPDPILGDAQRRRLMERSGTRLPLAEARDVESLRLFAFACEAARERLVLIAPRGDAASGRPRLPSRLLLRLASLVAGRPVGLEEFLRGTPLAPVWRRVAGSPAYTEGPETTWVDVRERDSAVLLSLAGRGDGDTAQAYLAAAFGDPQQAARRLAQWSAGRSPAPGAWDGLLGPEARLALEARRPFQAELHPTRLERYLGCPFAFLLQDVLELSAPEEPGDGLEMDVREFGTLAHAIMQRAYAAVIADDLDLDAALAAALAAWEASCADAEQRGVTGAALAWAVRRAMLLEDLLRCVRADPVFAEGGGRPRNVEWSFGEAAGRPVALELTSGRRVLFAGRVDRLDATPDGIRVVDYKTGAGRAEEVRLKRGLSVQLPVYQLAVRQAGDPAAAEITSCYRLVTRRGGFKDLTLPEPEAAATDRLRRLVSAVSALVEAGFFPRTAEGRCDLCDVAYACGTSAWSRARKRTHEALHDVVSLQLSGAGEEADGV